MAKRFTVLVPAGDAKNAGLVLNESHAANKTVSRLGHVVEAVVKAVYLVGVVLRHPVGFVVMLKLPISSRSFPSFPAFEDSSQSCSNALHCISHIFLCPLHFDISFIDLSGQKCWAPFSPSEMSTIQR